MSHTASLITLFRLSFDRALLKMLKRHGKWIGTLDIHGIWPVLEEIHDTASNPAGMLVRLQFVILTLDGLHVKDLQAKRAVEADTQSKLKSQIKDRILRNLCCSVLVPAIEGRGYC